MFKEFREFAIKGNVVDLAVGIVLGAAFGAIVNSLVTDVLMPIVGVAIGGIDFSQQHILLKDGMPPGPYNTIAAVKEAGGVAINIGNVINLVINFILVAFALFLIVKGVNAARRRSREAAAAVPAVPSNEEVLLAQIRDILQRRSA